MKLFCLHQMYYSFIHSHLKLLDINFHSQFVALISYQLIILKDYYLLHLHTTCSKMICAHMK